MENLQEKIQSLQSCKDKVVDVEKVEKYDEEIEDQIASFSALESELITCIYLHILYTYTYLRVLIC